MGSSLDWAGKKLIFCDIIAYIVFMKCECLLTQEYIHQRSVIEPQHDKTNRMTCAPSEDSDQTGWMLRLCAQWVAQVPVLHADSEDSDQAGRMPGLICLFWVHVSFCWFCHAQAQLL